MKKLLVLIAILFSVSGCKSTIFMECEEALSIIDDCRERERDPKFSCRVLVNGMGYNRVECICYHVKPSDRK